MDLLDALQLENMPDQYRKRVVINTKDENAQFAKDIKEVVESEEFEKVIDEQFKGFRKPEWMENPIIKSYLKFHLPARKG